MDVKCDHINCRLIEEQIQTNQQDVTSSSLFRHTTTVQAISGYGTSWRDGTLLNGEKKPISGENPTKTYTLTQNIT